MDRKREERARAYESERGRERERRKKHGASDAGTVDRLPRVYEEKGRTRVETLGNRSLAADESIRDGFANFCLLFCFRSGFLLAVACDTFVSFQQRTRRQNIHCVQQMTIFTVPLNASVDFLLLRYISLMTHSAPFIKSKLGILARLF